jgi:hypothetical protein
VYLAVVSIQHFKFKTFYRGYFITARQVSKFLQNNTANCVEFFVTEAGIKFIVKFFNRRQGFNDVVVLS